MAVMNITNHPATSNPDARKRMLRDAISKLNERCMLLKLAADSAAVGEAEEDLIMSLYWLHGEIERELDVMIALA